MRQIKFVVFLLLQVLLLASPFHFLFLSTVTVVYSATTGVQVKKDVVLLRTASSNMTLAADYECGLVTRADSWLLFNSSAPTYILNWPYDYSTANSQITVTGTEAAERALTFNFDVYANSIRIHGLSAGRFTGASYTASNSTLRLSLVGSGSATMRIYMTSCDSLYSLTFSNGSVVGLLPYYSSASHEATVPVALATMTLSLQVTALLTGITRTVLGTWYMGQPGTFTFSFTNTAPYELPGLKVRFQLLDGAVVKQDYNTTEFSAPSGAFSKSFSVTPTGITETKDYVLRLSLIKNSVEWVIGSWDHSVYVQALGSVPPGVSVSVPRLILPVLQPIRVMQGETYALNFTVQLGEASVADFAASTVTGIPSNWVTVQAPAKISSASPALVNVSIAVPSDAPLGTYDVSISLSASVSSGSSAHESAQFPLTVEVKSAKQLPASSLISNLLNVFADIPLSLVFIVVAAIVVAATVLAVTGEKKPKRHKYYYR